MIYLLLKVIIIIIIIIISGGGRGGDGCCCHIVGGGGAVTVLRIMSSLDNIPERLLPRWIIYQNQGFNPTQLSDGSTDFDVSFAFCVLHIVIILRH